MDYETLIALYEEYVKMMSREAFIEELGRKYGGEVY